MQKLSSHRPGRLGLRLLLSAALAAGASLQAQELLLQENFNTDGELANPPRYTTTGRDAYEVDRIQSELGLTDQLGPVYWSHNFEVSFVGVPAPTAGRRMIMAWDLLIDEASTSETMLKLWESSVKWMVNNKAAATVVVSPNAAALGVLGDRLAAAGHNVIDDDPGVTDANLHTQGDLFIHAVGSSNPSRGATAKMPVISMVALDHDDMLVSSIGAATLFQPGKGKIAAPTHPAAGGLGTAEFDVATSPFTFQLAGDTLPGGATTLATFTQVLPPTIASLADVDASISGAKQSVKITETGLTLDFADGTFGDWNYDAAVPGFPTGIWGIEAKGTLNVAAAGTYSFALGSDDGGRLEIDLNKNGFDASDAIITDQGPHGHTIAYGNAVFAAAGTYPFRVVGYNSGGGGSLEVSVNKTAGGGKTGLPNAIDQWELLGSGLNESPVTAQGDITITSFTPAGDDQEVTQPLIVLLNGPTDNPAGAVFGGGPFEQFEGTGFFGMSGGNKFPFPDGAIDRTLTLRPVNVAGKENLKVTVAVAGSFLDFETGDYLDLYAYPNGLQSTPERIFRFSAPDGSKKYFVDVDNGNINRLGLQFKDFTYDLPQSSNLVLEFRALTTWWNEIVAFDNVRVTAGAAAQPIQVTAARDGSFANLAWTGGQGPFLVQGSLSLSSPVWSDLVTTSQRAFRAPLVGNSGYFRIVDQTTKNVRHFVATLNGAAERPTPVDTPAQGLGTASVDMTAKTLSYAVSYSGLKQAASNAHIHGPADANTAAGVLVPLAALSPLGTSGLYGAVAVPLTDAQFNAITTGNSYFNIHSGAHGGGEIRGQIVPQ